MGQSIVDSESKYTRGEDGLGFKLNVEEETLKLACCDCGLVHHYFIDILDGKHIVFATEKDKRSTAQLRRHNYGYLQQDGWKQDRYRLVRVTPETPARIYQVSLSTESGHTKPMYLETLEQVKELLTKVFENESGLESQTLLLRGWVDDDARTPIANAFIEKCEKVMRIK